MFESPPFELTLSTRRLGHPLYFIPEIDSTNRVLGEMARQEAPEGTVILTDYQTTGRGRLGREWEAPRGSSLLMSALLRPPRLTRRHGLLPIVVGVAVARVVEEHAELQPALKWPNDLLLEGKKCCGILIESVGDGTQPPAVVIGIGLNVNQEEAALKALPHATSLRAVLGTPLPRGPLLAALLVQLEQAYEAFEGGWQPHDAWRRRAPMLGHPITVNPDLPSAWNAVAVDLDMDGSLIVRAETGQIKNLRAADVSIRPQV